MALVVGLAAGSVRAEIVLPPGFTHHVYVSGQGFDRAGRGTRGVPIDTALAVDPAGVLYVADRGNRYGVGREETLLSSVYRIPPGGARITPGDEARYAYGPPLRNPRVGAVGPGGALFVTTYDAERAIGVLYRIENGAPVLFAGGTPPAGGAPLLQQPEGVALDQAGHVYVADRARGVVVKLDPGGRVLDPQYLSAGRVRPLAVDETGHLWVGSDGTAARPWQDGAGQLWRVGPEGGARLVLEGTVAGAIAASPAGGLFAARPYERSIVMVIPARGAVEFARFSGESIAWGLAFAPDAPETRRGGIAGDLFVVTLAPRTWYVREVIRISGPFVDLVRGARHARQP